MEMVAKTISKGYMYRIAEIQCNPDGSKTRFRILNDFRRRNKMVEADFLHNPQPAVSTNISRCKV